MATTRRHGRQIRGSLYYIPVEEIFPSPVQPRKHFCDDGLNELRASIEEHGVLQPLTVRIRGSSYELVAGERRLRAAKLAGLSEVPCLILDVNMEQSSLIALVENLQRRDLDFIEEAEGIAQLIRVFGMSQEEVAKRLGKSQPAVANKLRLLRLPPDVLDELRDAGLTERHGRALLRLPTGGDQRATLEHVRAHNLTVAATEKYIDSFLAQPDMPRMHYLNDSDTLGLDTDVRIESGTQRTDKEKTPPSKKEASGRKTVFVLKDVRIFLNTVTRYVEVMRKGGIDVKMGQRDTPEELVVTIRIPKG